MSELFVFWLGEDSSRNLDLITLKESSPGYNNESDSGLLYDDVTNFSQKHYNFYTDS